MSERPFRVTLLLWLVLSITVWNAIRFWTAISWWPTLIEFTNRPTTVFAAISGASFCILGIIVFTGILLRKTWAKKTIIPATIGYLSIYWMERLGWQAQRPNWPFTILFQFILLLFIIYSSHSLASEAYERHSSDQ